MRFCPEQVQASQLMFWSTSIEHENPWDGTPEAGCRRRRIRVAAALKKHVLVVLFVALVLSLPNRPKAQSTLPPDEVIEGGYKKVTVTLDKDALRLVHDYHDILLQLEALTDAYSDYFSTVQVELTDNGQQSWNLISTKLEDGSYFEDFGRLETDITTLQQALAAKERALKEIDKRAFRLSHSLRQELEALRGLLQQEVICQLQENREMAQRIQIYLREAVTVSRTRDTERQGNIIVVTIGNSDTIMRFPAQTGKGPFVSVYELPSLPSVPEPPKISIARDVEFIERSGEVEVVREFLDSIRIQSTSEPIYISNPIGDLKISGWDRDLVLVQSEIELSSNSRSKTKELAGQVELRLGPKDDGIYVDLIVPNLTDPQTKIVNCALNIKVPKHNPLISTNSFGEVMISRMHNDVTLTASYSQIEVDGVDGRTEIVNAMGEVVLSRITGPIKVTNSYSPIEISRCHGDMEIENSFSSIELSHSEGDVVIRNSGHVDIVRHSGTIQIENKYGQVEVMKLDGDLTIQNSFQSLSIEDIFGYAKVNNSNGNIEAKNVQGEFSANNAFGRIYGSLLYGPIHLINHNGSIDVTLAEKVTGPSTIDASFGTVKVSVLPHSDLLLTATTIGGDIQSHFPVVIDEAGLTKTVELALGKGNNPLRISGNNSTIIISKAR